MSRFTDEEFFVFCDEFKKWQKILGMSGWQVYFAHEELDCAFAQIRRDDETMVATVYLNSNLPEKDAKVGDVKEAAKHEAIHLLTSRLALCAYDRFIMEEEIKQAEEELVRRLEGLIDAAS